LRRLRPINKTMGNAWTPSIVLEGHTADMDNKSQSTDRISRWFLQADFTVPFVEGWEGTASYTENYREIDFQSTQNYDIGHMIQGLNCDVANDRDACYSPFFVTDPANATKADVLHAIGARDREQVRDELTIIDVVFNGEIPLGGFELPGGVIAAAIGYQNRDDSFTNTPALVEIAGDAWIGSTEKENITSGNREVDAYFAELSIPVLSNLELQLAVRYEDFSTGQESTDPKFGVTYAATDWLTLRATTGDAFIAPSLEQLFNPETCGLATVTDRFGPFEAFTTSCGGGNPLLENEEAESQQFGFDLQFDSWDLSVTYNNTEFENRIITTSAQTLLQLDVCNFQQATGFTGDGLTAATQPSQAQLAAWVASGQQDPRINRAPDDLYEIILMKSGTSNAESVEVTAYDIAANYRFSLDNYGDFRIGLQATYIDEFLYQEDPTQPVVDGAGLYNDSTGAAPNLPEIKANLALNWTMGNHSVNAIGRYTDSMPYDGPTGTSIGEFANTFYPSRVIGDDVLTWTQLDLAYTYRGYEVLGGEAAFSIGSRNVFDRQAQTSPEFAGVLGELQDPMGRTIYARMIYDF
jgi:outer membrane receptor protein involved in Fe transport